MKKRVKQDGTAAPEGKTIPRLHLREVSPTDDDGPYEGIGADLRAARVETGVDIAAVANNLRISRGYLEAIEDGRFSDLPGGAYVFGFLRSYAEYLDLDPKSVVAKYKSESELPRAETKLAFPSPMDQGRLPTVRLLASSLLLAGLVYAGWYIVNGGQQQSAEVVSPVPERLAALLGNSASSDTTGQRLPAGERLRGGQGGQSLPGIAAPVQGVEIAPAGPPGEALIIGATQTQIPAPLAPVPLVASALDVEAANTTNEPALPLRRPEQQQGATLAPEETPAAVVPEETLAALTPAEAPAAATPQEAPAAALASAPVRAEEQASIAQPQEPATPSISDDVPAARTAAPGEQTAQVDGLGAFGAPAAAPARTEGASRQQAAAETAEPVAPAIVEAAAAALPPRRKVTKEPQVGAVESPQDQLVPPVVEPVREDLRIATTSPAAREIAEEEQVATASPTAREIAEEEQVATASPTAREIAEEEQVAAALAASPVIEQTPLPPPQPRAVPTEPAFLAAERAQNAERRRRLLAAAAADAGAPPDQTQSNGQRFVAAVAQPADVQAAVSVRSRSGAPRSVAIEVADLRPATEPEASIRESESVQLAAARRISELTNNEAAASGAVRSFPVPPPIPEGVQTAALNRAGGYVPQVFGASNEDSRVVIEAKLESWVQVRGRSGETLLTRILRVGDKYLVPNRPNLVMMTGNAGALKVMVDGQEIGPLGPPGAVLRNVSLEPSRLLARAASP